MVLCPCNYAVTWTWELYPLKLTDASLDTMVGLKFAPLV